MRTLVINSSHLVANGTQLNHFQYRFPNQWRSQAGARVAVAACSVYNSTFNVSPEYKNNTIEIDFGNGNITFTLPSGYYSIDQINQFLQQQFIVNYLYCTGTANSTQNVYFVKLETNSTRYSAQLTLYKMQPSDAYSPILFGGLPTIQFENQMPIVTISEGMGSLLGLPPGQYPPSQTQNYPPTLSYVSADFGLAPNVNIVIRTP